MGWEPHVDAYAGALSGALYGATKRLKGVSKWSGWSSLFDHEACGGVPTWAGGSHVLPRLGALVGLPMGPRRK
eukprot:1835050-Pyramimonas_sp.AAC.1